MQRSRASQAAVFVLATGLIAAAASAASSIAEYRAVAVNMSNVGRTGMTTLDIGIERWTTDEEAGRLRGRARREGRRPLTPELQKVKPRVGLHPPLDRRRRLEPPVRAPHRPGDRWLPRRLRDRPADELPGARRTSRAPPTTTSWWRSCVSVPTARARASSCRWRGSRATRTARAIDIENYANEPVRLSGDHGGQAEGREEGLIPPAGKSFAPTMPGGAEWHRHSLSFLQSGIPFPPSPLCFLRRSWRRAPERRTARGASTSSGAAIR